MKHYREESRKSMEAKCAAHGGNCKAHGGKAEKPAKGHKAGTKVNVIVAPHVGNRPVPVPVPVQGSAAGPSGAAPSRPVVRPAAPAGLAGLAGPAQTAPLKSGGRAHRAHGGRVGHFDAGAGSGEGRLEKTEHQKRRK